MFIGIGLGLLDGSLSSGSHGWLLRSGRWNDGGRWQDTAFWNDGPADAAILNDISTPYLYNGLTLEAHNAGASHSLARSINGAGNVLIFDVRSGERASFDVGTVERSEAKLVMDLAYGEEYWVSYSILVQEGTQHASGVWCLLGQVHTADEVDGGPAAASPFVAWEWDGKQQFKMKTRSGPSSAQVSADRYTDNNFTRGVWKPIVMRMVFGIDDDAELDIYVDGSLVYGDTGLNIGCDDDGPNPYWKFGDYRLNDLSHDIIRYAGFEFGTESLLSRVSSPLPIY